MRLGATPLIGMLLIDKPEGITSHDAVAIVRRNLGGVRVGHAGTLDPFASGLLVMAAGPATRLLEYISPLIKTYEAVVHLGSASSTDDRTGTVTAQPHIEAPTEEAVQRAVAGFVGNIQQVPPTYAAIKIAGKKLYEYARAGATIAAAARPVFIESIDIVSYDYPNLTLTIRCGSGTYIRSLARDVGRILGTSAYVDTLRRTYIGTFNVTDALLPEAVQIEHVQAAGRLVEHLPQLTLTLVEATALRQGKSITWPNNAQPLIAALTDEQGHLLGIGGYDPAESCLRPKKMLPDLPFLD